MLTNGSKSLRFNGDGNSVLMIIMTMMECCVRSKLAKTYVYI